MTIAPQCALDAVVSDVRHVCREHVALDLDASGLPPSRPGQFLQVRCGDALMLRRPFSIADRAENSRDARVTLISRAVGLGTRWLDALQVGMTVNISGPFGNGFALPIEAAPIALVGGGVGIPPLLYCCRVLERGSARHATAIFGATTHELLPLEFTATPASGGRATRCVRLPGDADIDTIITTDDGSLGLAGRVTDALSRWRDGLGDDADKARVYACGPEPMLHAIAQQTRAWKMPCQLCIERMMGCGMGTCLSCVVKVHDELAPAGQRWALTCSDGPVFERDLLVDMDPPARRKCVPSDTDV